MDTGIIEVCKGIDEIRDGRRPLMIIESLKVGDRAYELAVDCADYFALPNRCTLTYGVDGVTLGETVFIGRTEALIVEAVRLVHYGIQHAAFPLKRNYIAKWLGILLGYPTDEVVAFLNSEVHLRCACSCCGGPDPKRQEALDRQTRRTMYHA